MKPAPPGRIYPLWNRLERQGPKDHESTIYLSNTTSFHFHDYWKKDNQQKLGKILVPSVSEISRGAQGMRDDPESKICQGKRRVEPVPPRKSLRKRKGLLVTAPTPALFSAPKMYQGWNHDRNWLVSWFITFLGDMQPTYWGLEPNY